MSYLYIISDAYMFIFYRFTVILENMKLSVRIRGEWFAIPCKGTESSEWLGKEAIKRYIKFKVI